MRFQKDIKRKRHVITTCQGTVTFYFFGQSSLQEINQDVGTADCMSLDVKLVTEVVKDILMNCIESGYTLKKNNYLSSNVFRKAFFPSLAVSDSEKTEDSQNGFQKSYWKNSACSWS